MSPTVSEALADARRRLAHAGVPSPEADAEWMLGHVLECSRSQLVLAARRELNERDHQALAALVERRVRREPLQLILGTVAFGELILEVRPGVFVPRPETELLAEEAFRRCPGGGLVVEPCTGSGAVACAVAAAVPSATVLATDLDPAAVALARANAARCQVDVEVREGDLLDPLPPARRGMVDVLVANPPYLAEPELAALEPEVARWDPPAALVAGPTGHELTDRLISLAPAWLGAGGWLLLEVDERRARETAAHCAQAGLVDASVLEDLAGRNRIVAARRPSVGP